jgi:hypothetical protein
MGRAILAPELVFHSGNPYSSEEEEMEFRSGRLQDNFCEYYDKMLAGQRQSISVDPTLLDIAHLHTPQDFRAVEAVVGGDEWINYGRRNRNAKVITYTLLADGTYTANGTQIASGFIT